MKTIWTPKYLRSLPTVHQGQCCDCKIDTGATRVWLCRVAGGVTLEAYSPETGRWETIAGDCSDKGDKK